EVIGRRTEGRVDDPAFHIDREEAPDICARAVLPGAGRPGFRSRFARARHRMKGPEQLASPSVPAANVAVRSHAWGALAVAASGDDDIAKDGWRRLELEPPVFEISEDALLHIDASSVAELERGLAGDDIHGQQEVSVPRENAWMQSARSRPVRQSA